MAFLQRGGCISIEDSFSATHVYIMYLSVIQDKCFFLREVPCYTHSDREIAGTRSTGGSGNAFIRVSPRRICAASQQIPQHMQWSRTAIGCGAVAGI